MQEASLDSTAPLKVSKARRRVVLIFGTVEQADEFIRQHVMPNFEKGEEND